MTAADLSPTSPRRKADRPPFVHPFPPNWGPNLTGLGPFCSMLKKVEKDAHFRKKIVKKAECKQYLRKCNTDVNRMWFTFPQILLKLNTRIR